MKVIAIAPDSMTNPTGGLGVQWKEIYDRLKDKVDFYIASQPESIDIKNHIGVLHPMPAIKHGSVNTLIGNTAYLASVMRFPRPDIIHAMDWSVYLAGVYAAELFNVPLIVSMQLSPGAMVNSNIFNCSDFNTMDGKGLHKAAVEIEYLGLQKANKIIHVSRGYASNYFKQFSNKEVIIPNGIDIDKWKPTKKINFPGKGKFKIVYIGRFTEMKSVIPLLESDIPEEIDIIFIGAYKGGDVQSIKKLEQKVKEGKNIYHIGPLYDQDKIDALCSADAVIMPSKHEPFGIVGLEALASKSILLSSRIDGLGDFINDFNSLYCGYTKDSISQSFKDFLSLTENDKKEMIRNGIKTCEKYTWDSVANKYYETYQNILINQ